MFTLYPSIDLRDGKVVRLAQGDYAHQTTYDLNPITTAQGHARAGAAWLHVVDLDGAKAGRIAQGPLIGRIIAACAATAVTPGLSVQVGGGVREESDIQALLDLGAARVVVGTRAIEDWDWFTRLVPRYPGKLTLAVDAREGMIATRGWTQTSSLAAVEIARRVDGWPVAALLYTDVAKDGMLQGPNLTHTRLLAEAGRTPVLASGGVRSLEHIRQLLALPVAGVIVGRSLYEGTLDLAEAIRLAASR